MGFWKKALAGLLLGLSLIVIKKYANGPMYTGNERIDGKIAMVTGGNSGIGYETALDFAKRGAKVYLACRSEERGRAAAERIMQAAKVSDKQVEVLKVDLASMASIREFASKFKARERELHILVNNAGHGLGSLRSTEDGFEAILGTNHLGHFLLTMLLMEPLEAAAPSRVIAVSSKAALLADELAFDRVYFDQFTNETYRSPQTYARSKLYNILFALELDRRMSGAGVTAYSLHPGLIMTDIVKNALPWPWMVPLFEVILYPFWKDEQHGAQTSIFIAVDPHVTKQSGKFYSDLAECVVNCPVCEDMETNARKLWEASLRFVKLSPGDISDRLC